MYDLLVSSFKQCASLGGMDIWASPSKEGKEFLLYYSTAITMRMTWQLTPKKENGTEQNACNRQSINGYPYCPEKPKDGEDGRGLSLQFTEVIAVPKKIVERKWFCVVESDCSTDQSTYEFFGNNTAWIVISTREIVGGLVFRLPFFVHDCGRFRGKGGSCPSFHPLKITPSFEQWLDLQLHTFVSRSCSPYGTVCIHQKDDKG